MRYFLVCLLLNYSHTRYHIVVISCNITKNYIYIYMHIYIYNRNILEYTGTLLKIGIINVYVIHDDEYKNSLHWF